MGLVTPNLVPEERVLGYALLRRPLNINVFGVPQEYEDFIGVATDRRLVVFQTKTGGLMRLRSPVAKPVASSPVIWNYDELANFALGTFALVGLNGGKLRLDPVPGLGPYATSNLHDPDDVALSGRLYFVWTEVEGLPGQRQFLEQVLPWLDGQFRAGAFAPSPQRRQEIESRLGAMRAEAEASSQRKAAARAAARPRLIKAAIGGGGALLAAIGLGLVLFFNAERNSASDEIELYQPSVEAQQNDLSWARQGGPMPPGCPNRSVASPSYRSGCRGCEPASQYVPGRYLEPSGDQVRIVRGNEVFNCYSVEWREHKLSNERNRLENAQQLQSSSLVYMAVGLVLLLGGLAGAILGLRNYARRLARGAGQSPPS